MAGLLPSADNYASPRRQNVFGDVGSQFGNENLQAARDLAMRAGGTWYPFQMAGAGLLGALGLLEKGVGYGSEIVAGDTASERRLANDIMAMPEAFAGFGAGVRGVNMLDDVTDAAMATAGRAAAAAPTVTADAIGAARAISRGDKGLLSEVLQRGGTPQNLSAGSVGRELLPSDFQRVSTRLPTGRNAIEDPYTDSLISNTEAFLRNPSAAQNLEMMTQNYSGLRGLLSEDPAQTADNIIDHFKGNIISLYDLAEEAGITAESAKWYDGANRIAGELAGRFGTTPEKSAGVLAVMSPQKDWYQNVALGERLIKHWSELSPSAPWTPEMDAHVFTKAADKAGETAWTRNQLFDEVRGRPWGEMDTPEKQAMWIRAYDEAHFGSNYREVSPEGDVLGYMTKKDGEPSMLVHQSFTDIAKAMRILDGDGSLRSISDELGKEHKVRNFFNNILTPDSPFDATMDTHQIAGGNLMPWGSGVPQVQHGLSGQSAPQQGMPWSKAGAPDSGIGGAYGLYFDATKRAADEIGGWLPRQMQSITWEQLRALMPSTIRGKHPFVNTARSIWDLKDQGQITADQARRMIIEAAQAAGGKQRPSWATYTGPRRSIAKGAGATAGLLGLTGANLATAQPSQE